MLPSQILEKGWYPHSASGAVTNQCMVVAVDDENAALFSMHGAFDASYRQFTITVEQRAQLFYAVRAVFGFGHVEEWERKPERTKEEVLDVVRKAENFVMSLKD